MINTAEEFVALRLSTVPEEYGRATHDSAADGVWAEVIERYPELRNWVVHNKTVPIHILEQLSRDEDSYVRAAVARKRKTPHDVLARLARDPEHRVRLAVIHNRSTPAAILRTFTDDPVAMVAENAAKRLLER